MPLKKKQEDKFINPRTTYLNREQNDWFKITLIKAAMKEADFIRSLIDGAMRYDAQE